MGVGELSDRSRGLGRSELVQCSGCIETASKNQTRIYSYGNGMAALLGRTLCASAVCEKVRHLLTMVFDPRSNSGDSDRALVTCGCSCDRRNQVESSHSKPFDSRRRGHHRAIISARTTALRAICLLLYSLTPRVAGGYIFEDRVKLQVARDEWCADPAAAADKYGALSEWTVEGVADLSYLFCALTAAEFHYAGCNPDCARFNEDLSRWNVGSVTNMKGALHANHPWALDGAVAPNLRCSLRQRRRSGRVAHVQECLTASPLSACATRPPSTPPSPPAFPPAYGARVLAPAPTGAGAG